MNLYIVRHADYINAKNGRDKTISLKGREDTEKIACFIRLHLSVQIDRIYTSEKTRARDTAEIFSEFLKPQNGIKPETMLNPDREPGDIIDMILAEGKDIMIVGHRPFIDNLIALLTVNEECNFIEIDNSTVVCLRKHGNEFSIEWILKPEIIR